jgi:AraC-like DNA-binding protein
MLSLLVITCIIFQTAIAIFLLNGVRTDEAFDRHLRALLLILLVHLSTKLLLLAVLKDPFLYAQIPTGFGLAYGPLLLVIARSAIGRPLRPRFIAWLFAPFLVFSFIYVLLVIAGTEGAVSRPAIATYASWYEWLVLCSLYGYPLYVRLLLRSRRRNLIAGPVKKLRLTGQMANILLLGISAGMFLYFVNWKTFNIPGFDLRILPYICFSAIPVLVLRYRLQKNEQHAREEQMLTLQLALPTSVESIEPPPPLAPAVIPVQGSTVRLPDRRYEKSGMDASRMDAYEATLAAFMEKSKIYLDPDLSLESLAARMKMPKHHLTQLLNERIMKNFYSYINEYRIGEAIGRLNNPALQVNILSLAFDCGFNSRSSFNNYFKKITGFTPSAYRKLIPGTSHAV